MATSTKSLPQLGLIGVGSMGAGIGARLIEARYPLIVFTKAVVDSQCGFKLFKREICQDVFSRCRINGCMIDVEIFHIAHRRNIRIWFAPVYWDNKAGSTINVWRCVIFDPFDLIAIRLRGMRGVYEKFIERQPWQSGTSASAAVPATKADSAPGATGSKTS